MQNVVLAVSHSKNKVWKTLDHAYGSKWFVNQLLKLGFLISYNEVTGYKQYVVKSMKTDESEVRAHPEAFTRWVADNIDYNVWTLNGNNSFHRIGIIATLILCLPQSNDVAFTVDL